MAKAKAPEPKKPFWDIWKALTAIAVAGAAVAGAAFQIGSKWQEARANLDASKAMSDCNERVEKEKQFTSEYKEKYYNSIKENILTAAQNIKKEAQDGK